MLQFIQYYGKYQSLRGNFSTLPAWARGVVMIFAVPGLVAILLSILAFVVSLALLFLLTVPVYRLMQGLTRLGSRRTDEEMAFNISEVVVTDAPRRQIDVRIVE